MNHAMYFLNVGLFQRNFVDEIEVRLFNDGKLKCNVKGVDGYLAKVYVLHLWKILTSKQLPLKSVETLNGVQFINTYVEAFKKGSEYFVNEFSVTKETLFQSDTYLKNLHYCYYHSEPINGKVGWNFYEKNYPVIIHEKAMKDFGFFAGVIFEVELLRKKYPLPFNDFDACELLHLMNETSMTLPDFTNFKTLSDLTDNNEHFKKLRADLETKLNTAAKFITKKEFLIAEMQRVDSEYSRVELTVTDGQGQALSGFSYSKFQKQAYDSLLKGLDYPISNFLSNAKQEFSNAFKLHPKYVEHEINAGTFEANIISNLSTGVGWLLHKKHLAELLALGEEPKALSNEAVETKTPTAPAIALFCNLINDAEISKKESNEIPEKYCKRICENYGLKYTDRVRQNFNGDKSKKHYKEVTELILPFIDEITKDKIQKYLDSKNPPNPKLYA
jgi:hypothetical protein